MAERTRAVLVGCGGISRTWLTAITQMPEVEMVGLVDLYPEAAETRRDEFALGDGVPIGQDLGEMLDSVSPEVVFNCTIPAAHKPVALTALGAGCHVLGEKPLADTLANAQEMIAAAKQADRILAVIQNRRYDPQIRRLRHFIETNEFGPLTTVNADFYKGCHFGGFRDHMEHVLLLDMAIHTFDQARLLTGADPVAVYCHEWNPSGSWYDQDASAICIFEMSDGLVYTYRGSWCAEGLETTWECDWRLAAPQGTILWDGADVMRAERVVSTGGFTSEMTAVEVPAYDQARVGGHAGVIQHFVDCVRNGGMPETIAEDNIKSLVMVLGAIKSAETKKRVEIAW